MAGAWSMSAHNDACVTPYQGITEIAPASYAEGSWLFRDKELEESVRYGLYKIFMPGYKAPAIHTIPQERLIAEAVAKARQADVVVACVGEIETLNGEGASRTDISIPDAQKELLKALKATGKPVVMVLVTGRPLTLTWEDSITITRTPAARIRMISRTRSSSAATSTRSTVRFILSATASATPLTPTPPSR